MNSINEILKVIAIADVIITVVFNYFNSYAKDTASQSYKKRTVIANIVFLIVLLTAVILAKALKNS